MLAKRISKIWFNYLTGQCVLTLSVSGLTWLYAVLCGLPFALPVAVFAGICENIPNIGPVVATIAAGVLALIRGSSRLTGLLNWEFALLTAGAFILIQVLENYILQPVVYGKSVDMNPLLVFAGMLVFSSLFGFIGMILAVPLMATLRELFRYWRGQKETSPSDPLSIPPSILQDHNDNGSKDQDSTEDLQRE